MPPYLYLSYYFCSIQSILMDMSTYEQGNPPFHIVLGQVYPSALSFWSTVPCCPLRALAKCILTIVPTSAEIERLFSIIGKQHTKSCSSMSKETVAMVTHVKCSLLC